MELDAHARAIEAMQLKAPDAYGQSAFQGDAARWEALRRPCVAAVDKSGSFLDVGCANGLFLESAVKWAAQSGHKLEPYGLDQSDALAKMARTRLGLREDRIFVGDCSTWEPPRHFDFVRTELAYVPGERRREYVARLVDRFVTAGGRLIVASYGARGGVPPAEDVAALLTSWGHGVAGHAEGRDTWSDKTLTRVAWVARR
jgi:trans-aconitate methyltransferase